LERAIEHQAAHRVMQSYSEQRARVIREIFSVAAVGIGDLRNAMELVVTVGSGYGRGSGLVGSGRGLGGQIAIVVVNVADGSGLGIGGGEEAGERIIAEGAGAPVGGVGIVAFLVNAGEIVQRVVLIVGFVSTSRAGRQDAGGGIGLADGGKTAE